MRRQRIDNDHFSKYMIWNEQNEAKAVMKRGYKVCFCLLSVFYLSIGSYGFSQESPRVPQLHQKNPRSVSESLIKRKSYQLGPVIPGLQQGAVPQGLAYSQKRHLIFVSYYFDKHLPSSISAIDNSNCRAVATFALKESESSFHYGHVGGVAVDENFIWVSSDGKLFKYRIPDATENTASEALTPISITETETKASFVTYYENDLFVGEFAYKSKYKTKKSHHTENRNGIKHYAWVCGYSANNERNRIKYILSVRQKVQGICITDAYIFLSMSYGRRNRSTIAVYKNPLQEQPHKRITVDHGMVAPLWYLDEKNMVKEIDFPPMSEGITMINGKLAVLSESGAEKYQAGGLGPLDHILLLDVEGYL